MIIVDVHEAEGQPEALIDRALAGEQVVIARDSEPLMKLVPFAKAAPPTPLRRAQR